MSQEKNIFEKIYSKPGAVWTRTSPPQELVDFVEQGIIKPGKTLDVACGEGFYAIYLAGKGFDVLGIDLSEKAIRYAKENAAKQGAKAGFKAMDVKELDKLKEKFDFIFEWGLLHHLNRQTVWDEYVKNIYQLLNDGGKYLSMCFNDSSPEYGGSGGGYRSSPSGTKIYYSTQEEARELFKPHFKIIDEKLIRIPGHKGPDHIGNFFLMEKCIIL
ncbi:MAG: class I SAM-dependent methyltransferase [bacterium]|nr:class I SAM-dependent methyltransferase [bacterium]